MICLYRLSSGIFLKSSLSGLSELFFVRAYKVGAPSQRASHPLITRCSELDVHAHEHALKAVQLRAQLLALQPFGPPARLHGSAPGVRLVLGLPLRAAVLLGEVRVAAPTHAVVRAGAAGFPDRVLHAGPAIVHLRLDESHPAPAMGREGRTPDEQCFGARTRRRTRSPKRKSFQQTLPL